MTVSVLDPINKIEYKEGDLVEFAVHGDPTIIWIAKVRGKSIRDLIDFYIIEIPDYDLKGIKYSCITAQHTFLRPLDDNRPFLCEGVSRF